jgi:hypothetical protein
VWGSREGKENRKYILPNRTEENCSPRLLHL